MFTKSASPNGLAIFEISKHSYWININNLTEYFLAPTAEFRHPPWEVAFGKFGKSPRKGGFTRYFVDQYPTAQVPHLAVDLKTFD